MFSPKPLNIFQLRLHVNFRKKVKYVSVITATSTVNDRNNIIKLGSKKYVSTVIHYNFEEKKGKNSGILAGQ